MNVYQSFLVCVCGHVLRVCLHMCVCVCVRVCVFVCVSISSAMCVHRECRKMKLLSKERFL